MEVALLDKLHVAIKSVANLLIKQGSAKIPTISLDRKDIKLELIKVVYSF